MRQKSNDKPGSVQALKAELEAFKNRRIPLDVHEQRQYFQLAR